MQLLPPYSNDPRKSFWNLLVPARKGSAFSLVELLVVITIVALMSLLAIVGLNSASTSSHTNKAMTSIGGMMDFARQYAIAQDTYTYVAFSTNSTNLTATIFASSTGRSLFNSADLVKIAPPREIPQMILVSGGSTYGGWTPPTPPAPTTGAGTNWSITSQGKDYKTMVAFTPSGAASVKTDVLNEVIQFGLIPLNGDGKKGFAVRISGLTGLNTLLRP